MRVHRPLGLLVLALVSLLPACDVVTCPTVPQLAVSVFVDHADTGEPVADALAVARDGSYADSVLTQSNGYGRLAPNRAGTYEVTVEKDGFQSWTRSNVAVDLNECDQANTAKFQVDLIPQ